jgi:cytochrome c553
MRALFSQFCGNAKRSYLATGESPPRVSRALQNASTSSAPLQKSRQVLECGRFAPLFGAIAVAIASSNIAQAADASIDAQFFETKIRPVLVESCYKCHSADAERIKGGLLLDTRDGLLKGGDSGPAIVPGEPDKSRLIVALRYKDEQLQMPPKEPLSAEVIANFEAWVKAGAPDPRTAKLAKVSASTTNHWAFQPVKDRPAPKVKNSEWAQQPIDAFVLADLEERRLDPAPPADKRALLRRATFDLTGMPPTRDEITAFLADSSTNAFATVVDRLLKSPAFGERWGRHWLDLARYADSNGLEINTQFPNAYRYRDYVIAAFNKDKPYNDFIREQIAGDLLPSSGIEDQHEKWIATGFLVIGPKAFNEPNREKLLADVVDEQIDVTTKAFLALTVACARCHDHKFDPIPTRDYYALAGIFRSTQTLGEANPNRPTPFGGVEERPLGTEEETRRMEEFTAKLSKAQEELQQFQKPPELAGGIDSKDLAGIVVDNAEAEVMGNWAKSRYSTNNFVNNDYLHDGNSEKGTKIVRFRPTIDQAGTYEIRLSYTPRYDRATNVPVTIYAGTNVTKKKLNQREAPKFDKAFAYLGLFDLPAGTNSVVEVSNEGTKGFVVVDAVQFLPLDNSMKMAMNSMSMGMMGSMQNTAKKIGKTYAGTDVVAYQDKIAEIQAQAPPPLPAAMAVKDTTSQNARIAIRGDVERLGDEVPRGFIQVIDRKSKKVTFSNESSGRLELANWIASPDNPLTSRVFVNRVWQHLFGRAIVNTPDNFGLQGDAPANPELLDFLATQFVQNGWSVKKLIRSIMLSSAYQMSDQLNPTAYAKDPDNRLVWRMNRKRLEAEEFRDAMLALSGKLDGVSGGPTFPSANAANGQPIIDGTMPIPQSARRSVYMPTLRNNLDDLFLVFDFPDPHTPMGKRHVTSAATQALYVMNSPFVQDQAKAWAQRLEKMPNLDDAGRITRAFVEAFAREPNQSEMLRSKAFLNEFTEAAESKEPDAGARRSLAWQSFCQALMASAEFRYLN